MTETESIPFIDEFGVMTVPGTKVAHDVGYSGGLLPDGVTWITGAVARVPHSLAKASAPITSRNMEPRHFDDGTHDVHRGLDFGVVTGTEVKCMAPGVVYSVGYDSDGWGYNVQVRHEGYDYYSHYAHMQSNIQVTVNQQVYVGTILGYSDNSGISSGAHLDAAFDCYYSGARYTLYPFSWFLSSSSPYSAGDFDYITAVATGWSSTYGLYFVQANVAASGSSGGTSNVYVVYRPVGGSWTEQVMPPYSGTTYRYYFPTAMKGKTINYYIKAVRQLVPDVWVTSPACKAGAEPGIYYTYSIPAS